MATLELHGTPLSHFTRKVRILLAELGVAYDFVRASSVLATSPEAYGNNPLMRVPTLVHGDVTLIDSDHIARYLVAAFDPQDRLGVESRRADDLNRLAVVNGIMANGVVLILAKRGGLADVEQVAYFRKLAGAIDTGLAWLDAHVVPEHDRFDYGDIAMVCMWQHLVYYGLPMLAPLDGYPRLAARVAHLSERDAVARTTPEASLAEATAAGWSPA
jgi:glutathione S-transferase